MVDESSFDHFTFFEDQGDLLNPRQFFEDFVKKVALERVKSQAGKLKNQFTEHRVKLKETGSKIVQRGERFIKSKRQLLENKRNKIINDFNHSPPFLRNVDKIAFTLGIIVLCLTEFILLQRPELMSLWYTFLVIPLLSYRFVKYHSQKFHYFMFDFCYYVQALLLFYLYIYPQNSHLFELLFCLCNGPLVVGILAWRNSLVFHDLDKLTSVFIHIFPPLVTYTTRWYPSDGTVQGVCKYSDCHIPFFDPIKIPLLVYVIWQLCYVLKTDIVDKQKLANDEKIVTSLRWMTQIRPHPIWLFLTKRGYRFPPTLVIVVCQLIYTLVTLLPVKFIFESQIVHSLYLSAMVVMCVWNGACFYFEAFAESYSRRLYSTMEEEKEKIPPTPAEVLRHVKSADDLTLEADYDPNDDSLLLSPSPPPHRPMAKKHLADLTASID
eukprot:TRINITY_DN6879_c0_g1_i1.p1 TRINITY_DN6879_c0_g1~~TRINITY_DN6879_c0_g1_i1.p1  ORF type:complete len:437 (-),score=57.02 TRINITY_DN6879_c0_g1_i1:135-1445(-)